MATPRTVAPRPRRAPIHTTSQITAAHLRPQGHTHTPASDRPMGKFSRAQENLVASFRGLPGAHPRGRPRRTVDMEGLMEELILKHKLMSIRLEAQLMPQWGYVVGENNAHKCAPVRIEGGKILRVACSHPTMVRELTFNKKIIMRRLQSICPTLHDIKFVTG